MLKTTIAWSLENRLLVLAGTLVIALAGTWSLSELNFDAFPDTTPVQVQINTDAPGLVATEVERLVTFPIEALMGGMPGLAQVRSISQFGVSQVVVTFEDGTDVYLVRQIINERLSTLQVPPGIPRPELGPVATGLGEVFHYMLIPDPAEGQDLMELRRIQDWEIKPALRIIPGAAEVNTWGGLAKQYQVRVDPIKLFKYDLTLQQLMQAIRTNNINVGGGYIERGGKMLVVQGIGRTVNVPQIEEIVIAAKDGVPIYVSDVADVVIGHEIRKGLVTSDGGGEVVLGLGFMRIGESSYTVTREFRDELENLLPTLPHDVKVVVLYDRTKLVDQVIATVRNNLCEGGFLVVAILFLFLGNLRAGLIAAASIPLSMLFAFCGMYQCDVAGTLLSLGAIDFGIVVDSSVVVLESIVRQLAHAGSGHGPSRSRLQIIRDAAIEVRKPAVFGQLIIMIVYIPILSLQGVEGKMFRPMAITVVFVLVGSLVLSLTLTPVAASFLLPRKISEEDVLLVRAARWLYAPVLRWGLTFPGVLLGVAGAALLASAMMLVGMGTEFVPQLAEGAIAVDIRRVPGTSLEQSALGNTQMERALLDAFPDEVERVWSRVGKPEVNTDTGTVESTDIFITLAPRENWKRATTQSELVALMSREFSQFKGQDVRFSQPIEMRINEMLTGIRADVALKLFGNDLETLLAKAQELQAVLRSIPGSADLFVEEITGQPMLQIKIDQDEIARYGIPAESVLDIVETVSGKAVGEVVEDQLRYPLAVRLPDRLRASPNEIAEITMTSPSGERIPLLRLTKIEEVRGPKLIPREWSKRRITVQCNVRGRDVGTFIAEAQKRVASDVQLPAGYRLEWGGQFENMERARKRLMLVVPLALVSILVLLYLSYHSVVDTVLLFASVPFACVGGVTALWFRDMPLSISAAVGFITLSGVSVLNSMVLVSAFRDRLAEGLAARQAIEGSSLTCLRTILMTATIASVGFVPMAFSEGMGAEVQRPLATVVIGGVISSTLMTLVLLPVLYDRLAAVREGRPKRG
ncbi:MAG: efflux RND transporter permease subunit [Planctomycetes bacterium]|nr:efflux RND transporter permease subunit [Planctomycetota bacterium]